MLRSETCTVNCFIYREMMQRERIWPLRPSCFLDWLKCQLNYGWSWTDASGCLMFLLPKVKHHEAWGQAETGLSVCVLFTCCKHTLHVVSQFLPLSLCRAVFFAVNFVFSDPFTIKVARFILCCKTAVVCFLLLYSVENSECVIYKCLRHYGELDVHEDIKKMEKDSKHSKQMKNDWHLRSF